ncbi:MAG: metal-dependent transcriptional regulator [Chloroflexi bacterium]|nr:metal-dependent transcriptional regulator [Chloroflexota bacterium]
MSSQADRPGQRELSESAQSYLLALRSLTGEGASTTISALGRRMTVSKQAASEMVGRLANEQLVIVSGGRELRLTDDGRHAADTIFRRHSLLEWLLIKVVGLGWAESDEEAARLQGHLSPRVEERIAELVGNPPTCPHGNPISAPAARQRPKGIPLAEATEGSKITIYRITEEAEEDAELLVYLEEHGLVPGTAATVTEVSGARESITLDSALGASTMGLRPASLIRVLPGRADPGLFHNVPAAIEGLRRSKSG